MTITAAELRHTVSIWTQPAMLHMIATDPTLVDKFAGTLIDCGVTPRRLLNAIEAVNPTPDGASVLYFVHRRLIESGYY